MRPIPQQTEDFVTFTEEILNGKLHILCSDSHKKWKIVRKVVLIRVFVAELEFPNILVSRLPENTSNVNIESNEKSKQWYYLCD